MHVKVGPCRRLNVEELMLLTCDLGKTHEGPLE